MKQVLATVKYYETANGRDWQYKGLKEVHLGYVHDEDLEEDMEEWATKKLYRYSNTLTCKQKRELVGWTVRDSY